MFDSIRRLVRLVQCHRPAMVTAWTSLRRRHGAHTSAACTSGRGRHSWGVSACVVGPPPPPRPGTRWGCRSLGMVLPCARSLTVACRGVQCEARSPAIATAAATPDCAHECGIVRVNWSQKHESQLRIVCVCAQHWRRAPLGRPPLRHASRGKRFRTSDGSGTTAAGMRASTKWSCAARLL